MARATCCSCPPAHHGAHACMKPALARPCISNLGHQCMSVLSAFMHAILHGLRNTRKAITEVNGNTGSQQLTRFVGIARHVHSGSGKNKDLIPIKDPEYIVPVSSPCNTNNMLPSSDGNLPSAGLFNPLRSMRLAQAINFVRAISNLSACSQANPMNDKQQMQKRGIARYRLNHSAIVARPCGDMACSQRARFELARANPIPDCAHAMQTWPISTTITYL